MFSGVHKAWIGINDKKTQGEFVYTSSGEKITSSDWAFFQPDNMAGSLGFFKWQTADCVIFGLNEIMNEKWYDQYCTWKRYFICETM